jgi:hypothetical protein
LTSLALAIATKGEWDPQRLLAVLAEAGASPSTEVHLACDPAHMPAGTISGLSIHLRAGVSLFGLWGLAIGQAKADWVAILHADALPAPGWFAAMSDAIEREGWRDGYWGPVDPDFSSSDLRMVGYLTEYVQFHWPIGAGMKEVPGSNLVLPRQRLGCSGEGFSKTRLLGEGLAPRLIEGAKVRYARPFSFADYCGRRYRHGRAYAAKRDPALSLTKAIPLALALPFVRTDRVRRYASQYSNFRAASLRWLPAILLAETCWSAGELMGYVTGRPGDAARLD